MQAMKTMRFYPAGTSVSPVSGTSPARRFRNISMNNPEAVWLQIVQLKEMGFKTAIDDFGAGYSSLGIVQMLDADCLKIDRSFIQRDLPGQRAQIVLGNIIRLASDLGMQRPAGQI